MQHEFNYFLSLIKNSRKVFECWIIKEKNQDEICTKGKYLFEITNWVFVE